MTSSLFFRRRIFPVLFCLIFSLIFCSGCAKLENLEELLTLKGLSKERDAQDGYMQKQDENFEKLLAAAQNNSVGKFSSRRRFQNAFGEPIVSSRVVGGDGKTLEKWLYRYAARPLGSPKVYVYFDQRGKLVEWQYLPRDADETKERLEKTKNNEPIKK